MFQNSKFKSAALIVAAAVDAAIAGTRRRLSHSDATTSDDVINQPPHDEVADDEGIRISDDVMEETVVDDVSGNEDVDDVTTAATIADDEILRGEVSTGDSVSGDCVSDVTTSFTDVDDICGDVSDDVRASDDAGQSTVSRVVNVNSSYSATSAIVINERLQPRQRQPVERHLSDSATNTSRTDIKPMVIVRRHSSQKHTSPAAPSQWPASETNLSRGISLSDTCCPSRNIDSTGLYGHGHDVTGCPSRWPPSDCQHHRGNGLPPASPVRVHRDRPTSSNGTELESNPWSTVDVWKRFSLGEKSAGLERSIGRSSFHSNPPRSTRECRVPAAAAATPRYGSLRLPSKSSSARDPSHGTQHTDWLAGRPASVQESTAAAARSPGTYKQLLNRGTSVPAAGGTGVGAPGTGVGVGGTGGVFNDRKPSYCRSTSTDSETKLYRENDRNGDKHTYICTTGTDLYRMLALSEKLSTESTPTSTDDSESQTAHDELEKATGKVEKGVGDYGYDEEEDDAGSALQSSSGGTTTTTTKYRSVHVSVERHAPDCDTSQLALPAADVSGDVTQTGSTSADTKPAVCLQRHLSDATSYNVLDVQDQVLPKVELNLSGPATTTVDRVVDMKPKIGAVPVLRRYLSIDGGCTNSRSGSESYRNYSSEVFRTAPKLNCFDNYRVRDRCSPQRSTLPAASSSSAAAAASLEAAERYKIRSASRTVKQASCDLEERSRSRSWSTTAAVGKNDENIDLKAVTITGRDEEGTNEESGKEVEKSTDNGSHEMTVAEMENGNEQHDRTEENVSNEPAGNVRSMKDEVLEAATYSSGVVGNNRSCQPTVSVTGQSRSDNKNVLLALAGYSNRQGVTGQSSVNMTSRGPCISQQQQQQRVKESEETMTSTKRHEQCTESKMDSSATDDGSRFVSYLIITVSSDYGRSNSSKPQQQQQQQQQQQ